MWAANGPKVLRRLRIRYDRNSTIIDAWETLPLAAICFRIPNQSTEEKSTREVVCLPLRPNSFWLAMNRREHSFNLRSHRFILSSRVPFW